MAKVNEGVGSFLLIDEKPNLLLEAVKTSIADDTELTAQLIALYTKGFNKNVRSMRRYFAENLPVSVPFGEITVATISQGALNDLLTTEVMKQIDNSVPHLQNSVAELTALLGPTHPETVAMQSKLDAYTALSISRAPTIVINSVTTSDVDRQLPKITLTHLYFTRGFAFTTDDVTRVYDSPSSATRIEMTRVEYEGTLFGGIRSYTFIITVIKGTDREEFGDNIRTGDPDWALYNDLRKEDSTAIHYSVSELGLDTSIYYVEVTSRIPDEITEELTVYRVSDELPICQIREGKQFIGEENKPTTYGHTKEGLKQIEVNLDDVIEGISSIKDTNGNNAIEHIDDTYIMFMCKMLNNEPIAIKYLIAFFSAMYFELEAKDYETSVQYEPLPASANVHRDIFGDIETNFFNDYNNLPKGPSRSYRVKMPIDAFNYYIGFSDIYSYIHNRVIGKIGTAHMELRPDKDTETVEYSQQITLTTCRIVRVMRPQVQYRNFWSGDSEVYGEYMRLFFANDDIFSIPVRFAIVDQVMKGLDQSYLYMETISVFFTTIQESEVKGWQIFLSLLLQIILVVLSVLILPVVAVAVGIITTILSKIVLGVISDAAGPESAAVAGVALGILTSIFSLGSSLSTLLKSVIDVALAIIGFSLQLVQLTFSIQAKVLANSAIGLLEQIEESDRLIKEKREELDLDTRTLNPLNIINNILSNNTSPQEMLARNLMLGTNALIDLTVNFADKAITLPELEFDPITRKGYIPSYT